MGVEVDGEKTIDVSIRIYPYGVMHPHCTCFDINRWNVRMICRRKHESNQLKNLFTPFSLLREGEKGREKEKLRSNYASELH